VEILDLPDYEGFSHGNPSYGNGDERLRKCVRIFPHKMNGEGHFLALLHKPGDALDKPAPVSAKVDKDTRKWLEEFFKEIGLHSIGGLDIDWNRIESRGEKIKEKHRQRVFPLYSRLSSGHKIILLTIANLIDLVEEKTILGDQVQEILKCS
jgi:hypothetical protein